MSRVLRPSASVVSTLLVLLAAGAALSSCDRAGGAGETRAASGSRVAPSGAQPDAGGKVLFVPARFFAGDEVEALVSLSATGEPGASGFELKPGAGLPAQGAAADPELRSVAIAKGANGWEARLRFVPWSPGPGLVPAVGARGFLVPPIPYNVASSLGADDRDLAPPRAQREPPGTAIYLYAFAGAMLALVLAALGFAVYLIPAARAVLGRWRAAQAFRRLRRVLGFLCRGLESTAPELFYAALARELRIYLAQRVEPRIPSLSSRELAALPESAFPAPGLRESAAALIAETEHGRYAGELEAGAAAAPILRVAADRALALGQATEEAVDARL